MARVVIVVFEGVQTLDVTGPAEVFANAARAHADRPYTVEVASIGGGNLRTTCGVPIGTRDLRKLRPHRDDLVLVAGGPSAAIVAAVADRQLRAWLCRAAKTVRRIGSVCSGAFVLAAAGLLDGKRATTHWSACDRLATMFPAVDVDRNAIFVTDGQVWTSAGVTTGIDMALAIVEEDLGREVADAVAANLVLYMRRPGYQSQWSDALVARAGADPLGPTIAWARANLGKADIETLAHRAGLSVRTFHRRCLDQLSTTPAKLLDKLRVERARDLLATTELPAKTLASTCGFTSPARMKRAFERELGIGPRAYRFLHER
ncbi:MAG: AraC family transcriptional regulator [Myxococcales bacterium]|nr:AraC family transcriptional regulator [Myxococcales bacterium]